MEELITKQCPQCGYKIVERKLTDNGVEYECKLCHTKWVDSSRAKKGTDSNHNEYRAERIRVKSQIERLMDTKFRPHSCPNCGRPGSKLIEECNLNDGFQYYCPKCEQIVETDNNAKQALDKLYALREKYPNEADRDPVFHYLFIRFWTRNFQQWNEKIEEHITAIEKSSFDKEDIEEVETFKKAFEMLYVKTHKKTLERDAKVATKNIKKAQKEEKSKKKKEYYKKTEEGKAKRKKKVQVIGFLVAIIMMGAATFAGIWYFSPETLFGKSKIEYYIDGEKETIEALYGKNVQIEKPAKTGYIFKGFFDAEIGGSMVIGPDGTIRWNKTGNGTYSLYAQWEAKKYSLQFDVNGGVSSSGAIAYQSVKYGENVNDFTSAISRNGYVLEGWTLVKDDKSTLITDENGKIIDGNEILNDNNFIIPEGDISVIVVYALWSAQKYEIAYSINESANESIGKKTGTVTFDAQNALLTPTKIGYSFVGWMLPDSTLLTDAEGNLLKPWKIASDGTILSARWEINNYSVSVELSNTDAGTIKINNRESTGGTFQYDLSLALSLQVKTGYKFIGWYDENDKKLSDSIDNYHYIVPDKDVTIIAKCEGLPYKITYDPETNGGSMTDSKETQVLFGAMTRLAVAQKTGYDFVGWYIGTEKITNEQGEMLNKWHFANDDQVLIATYTIKKYKLNIIVEPEKSGKVFVDDVLYTNQSYEYGSKHDLRFVPNDGYNWKQWIINGRADISEEIRKNITITENNTYKAYSSPKTYTISSYDYVGGSLATGEQEMQTWSYSTNKSLPVLVKTGYTFVGWHLVKNNSESSKTYKMFEAYDQEIIRYASDDNLRLRAVWQEKSIRISFTNCSGLSPIYSKYNQWITLPTPTSNDDAVFAYWTIDGEKVNATGIYVPAYDVEVEAKWTKRYSVKANPNNCSLDNGYDDSKPSNDTVAKTEIDPYICDVIIDGTWKESGNYETINGNKNISLKLKLRQDIKNITRIKVDGSSVFEAWIEDDSCDRVKDTPINGRIGRGAVYMVIKYEDGTEVSGYARNIFEGKEKGETIDLLNITGLTIEKDKKVSVIQIITAYEICGKWSGFFIPGVTGGTYTNWRTYNEFIFS